MANSPTHFVLGERQYRLEVPYRISPRARRVSLKVDIQKGPELVIPKRFSLKKAQAFLLSNELWLRRKLADNTPVETIPFAEQQSLPIYGKDYEIAHSGKLRGLSYLEQEKLVVNGLKEHVPRKIEQFLQVHTKQVAAGCVQAYSEQLGVQCRAIRVRDTATRWGSCSQEGVISLSWRLILAPPQVFDYVVAHEVSHLKEMNHSQAFWRHVEKLIPDYLTHRQWLRQNGHTLYRFGK